MLLPQTNQRKKLTEQTNFQSTFSDKGGEEEKHHHYTTAIYYLHSTCSGINKRSRVICGARENHRHVQGGVWMSGISLECSVTIAQACSPTPNFPRKYHGPKRDPKDVSFRLARAPTVEGAEFRGKGCEGRPRWIRIYSR